MSVGAGIIPLQQNERKTKMSKIKTLIDEIKNCEMCFGQGYLYYGNDEMYDIEACLCNPESIEVDF